MAYLPLSIGDPAPWFSGTNGSVTDRIAFDELAGRFLLLFFFGSASRPDFAAALSALDPRGEIFDGEHALFLGVGNDPEDFARRRLPERVGHKFLLDLNGNAARHYGLATFASATPSSIVNPTAFLLSPSLQILNILPFEQPDAFVERAGSLIGELVVKPRPEQPPPC